MGANMMSIAAVQGRIGRSSGPPIPGSLTFQLWLPRTRQCVFNAWTIPEYIELWTNTDPGSDVRADVDRSAESFLLVAQRDAVPLYRVAGTYLVVDQPNRIILTWAFRSPDHFWDCVAQVDFVAASNGTRLKISLSNIDGIEHRHLQERWWEDRLDRLKTLLS